MTLGPFEQPTVAPKGAKENHFRTFWSDKWKCENYAPVDSARASSVCASAEVSGCWVGMRSEVVLGGCFWLSESHSGNSGQGNLQKTSLGQKKPCDLEAILKSF